jgi:hypothetical protein
MGFFRKIHWKIDCVWGLYFFGLDCYEFVGESGRKFGAFIKK